MSQQIDRERLLAAAKTFAPALLVALALAPAAAFAAGGHSEGMPTQKMIFHGINLALLLGFLFWVTKNPIRDALRNRAATVKQDLEESNQIRKEAQDRFDQLDARLSRFEETVSGLKADATREAEAEAARIAEQTEAEVARIASTAEKTIRDETIAARAQLRREAIELAVKLAEENLRGRITSADHDRMARDLLGAVQNENTNGVNGHG